jgi:hypothetical protein
LKDRRPSEGVAVDEVAEQMPKRTNKFQQLIYHIYEQMAARGARVTESALLQERDGDGVREVDILIEDDIAGETVRMAVECRDQERKASVEWIDQIIGKYRDLDVQKIIAVSRSGFSAQAEAKAAANNIETRTLEEALETNWPKEFVKIGIAKVTYRPSLREVRVETDPILRDVAEVSGEVTDEQENTLCTLYELAMHAFRSEVQVRVREHVSGKLLELFKTIEDLLTKAVLITVRVPAPNIYLLMDDDSTQLRIVALTFEVIVQVNLEPGHSERRLYANKAQVTTSVLRFGEPGIAYNLDVVQIAGKEHGKLLIRPAKDIGK